MPGKNKLQASAATKQKIAKEDTPDRQGGLLKWAPLAIVALTAIIYTPALQNGFTSFDDDFYILKNPFLRDFSWHGLGAIFSTYYQSNYHPLTTLTFFLEFHFWGLNPMPYHALNVLLHLLNTWLVFKCCEKLGGNRIGALMVSALFAIHPMHVESVAWVSERKDVLYSAFYLAALYTYLQYISEGLKVNRYWVMSLLFIGSLLSKSAAVTLPVLLIAVDIYKGRKLTQKTIIEKIPLLALSLVFGVVNIFAQKAGGPVNILFAYYGVVKGIFLFTSGIVIYLLRAIVPFDLSAMHYFPNMGESLPWLYYLSLPFLILLVWLFTRIKKDAPFRRDVIFGALFFFITISVMLQLVSVGSALTAERYTYIPYIGLFYILAQWLTTAARDKKYATTIAVAVSLISVLFCIETYNRVGVWKDDETLLSDVIEKNPGITDVNYIYMLRGDARINSQDLKGAIDDFGHALAISPYFSFAASTYFGRAHAYDVAGDLQAALSDLNNVIKLNRKLSEAYNSRGWVYFRLGDPTLAIRDYDTAIALKPGYAEAYNNRGWAYNSAGNLQAALSDYNKAIAADPQFEKPFYNRATIKANAGDLAGAIADYDQLIAQHPGDNMAYLNRGQIKYNAKNAQGACEDWKKSADMGNQKAVQMMQQYCR